LKWTECAIGHVRFNW